MVKVKCGAITKEVSNGALKWYKMAGWKVLDEKKPTKKEEKNDKTNTEEVTSS